MLRSASARRSDSLWASPLHIVPKIVDGWRPWETGVLNARTVSDQYPVRHIADFAHQLAFRKVVSTIDLVKAYQQITVHPTTPVGLFEFPYTSFGLRNGAQTFQRFIDEVLRDLDFCYAYIDDVLVTSTSEEDH